MDADLEALIKAYDAFIQARGAEARVFLDAYNAKLEEVLLRHLDIFEKDLVEAFFPRHLDQRPHADAGTVHIHQQVADALVFGRFGVGAHQQDAPVGAVRTRRPDLLPVHDEVVAVLDRARVQ